MSNCSILAAGIINALGMNNEQIRARLFSDSLSSPLSKQHEYQPQSFLGLLPETLEAVPSSFKTLDSQYARILFNLYQQIEDSIDDLKRIYPADRIAVVLGTSTAGVDASEDPFRHRARNGVLPESYYFFNQEHGAGSTLISKLAGVSGPSYSISTACSSSAKVFASAKSLLDLNLADAVIAGGADSICAMTIQGFNSLELLSPEISQPLSKNRQGLNIGEGGALFAMVRSDQGVKVQGVGESSDAYHISAPDPSGAGAIAAIVAARENVSERAVKYMNLHGTGTVLNDAMESRACFEVLGDKVACSSTKPLTGHLLGGCGATEVALCWLMLTQSGSKKRLLPHVWDGQRDEQLPPLDVVRPGQEVAFSSDDIVLSNSFAFGGSNCCVALGY
jgi:3-oxoacyl-[acyl-carrier-protein] synthase-1